jgi:DNA-binding GntR family transcriptional regulator
VYGIQLKYDNKGESAMIITLSREKSMSERSYEELKKMILHLQIKPREHIQEEKITELLNCSRTPVREALRRLFWKVL